MTNLEILQNLPCGEVVTSKQILSAMKKKGLIYDYSRWAYLENCRIWYKEEEYSNYVMAFLFPNSNSPRQYDNHPNISHEEILDRYNGSWGKINYLGFEFEIKYLSGCFNPYLVKTGPKTEKKVNRTISLWGAIG